MIAHATLVETLAPEVLQFAQQHGGLIDRRTLLELGYSYKQIRGLISRGQLSIFRGGYTVRGGLPAWLKERPQPIRDAARSAHSSGLTFGPLAIITGADAALLQGCAAFNSDGTWNDRFTIALAAVYATRKAPLHSCCTEVLRREFDGTVVHRGGLRLADRETALIDMLEMQCILDGADGYLPTESIDFLDLCLQRRWLTPSALAERLARRLDAGRKGRRGTRVLRLAAEFAAAGTQSEAERKMESLLRGATLRAGHKNGWRANYRVDGGDHNGPWHCFIDFAWPACMLAVEVDGRAFHSSAESFQSDRTRAARLAAAGWTVIAFTWDDIVKRQHSTLRLITDTLRRLRPSSVYTPRPRESASGTGYW